MAYTGNHPLNNEMLDDREVRRQLHRHAMIERKLNAALAGPMIDWDGVRLLKRDKIKVMEELMRLKRRRMMN